ncbi:N-ATPase subunit AtpR [Pseudomonas aeruginosa]
MTLGVLLVAARQGWGGLLAAAAGFMAARQVVLHRLGAVS